MRRQQQWICCRMQLHGPMFTKDHWHRANSKRYTHKSISPAFASASICDDHCFLDLSKLLEELPEWFICGVVGQTTNKYLGECGVFLLNCSRRHSACGGGRIKQVETASWKPEDGTRLVLSQRKCWFGTPTADPRWLSPLISPDESLSWWKQQVFICCSLIYTCTHRRNDWGRGSRADQVHLPRRHSKSHGPAATLKHTQTKSSWSEGPGLR